MSDNKRTGRGSGKGYYIALILCAAAIGITGYVFNRNAEDRAQQADAPVPEATVSGDLVQADIPVIATQPDMPDPTAPSGAASAPTEKRMLKTVAPVSGQTLAVYSMEALSYNETTRDWRVHDGVDIAAAAGTDVVASADGEVVEVFEDDTMGHTVMIRHVGGYTTCYASLAQEVAVKPGDMVTAGQVIGQVGDTALVETAMGPHLHFSVTYQGEPMDPGEFLTLGA